MFYYDVSNGTQLSILFLINNWFLTIKNDTVSVQAIVVYTQHREQLKVV